jgi:predicted Rossmann-fold nucleotide-binding protein
MVLFGRSYWSGLLKWIKSVLDQSGFISPGDMDLYSLTDDPKEAVEIIMRYVRQVGPPETVPKAFE